MAGQNIFEWFYVWKELKQIKLIVPDFYFKFAVTFIKFCAFFLLTM